MGLRAWQALGDVAQLPAWNAALATLGDRFDAVENRSAQDQTGTLIDVASPLLRCLARHIAIEEANPDLFHALESVTRHFKVQPDWSMQWWDIPFTAVIGALHAGYAQIPGTARHLEVLERAQNVDDLRAAFHDAGIETNCNPYEFARQNTNGLDKVLRDLHDLHRTWVELTVANSTPPELPSPLASLDPSAYLNLWTETELLHRALRCIGDSPFVDACAGCMNVDEIRNRLALDPEAVAARHRQRREQEREKQRQRRTFDVAGIPVEVGTTSLADVFEHLQNLPPPAGPRASRDSFTELATPPATRRSTKDAGAPAKTSHLRPPRELRDLVGVVGEMHAYRFLRNEFGSQAVTPDAWVSEVRQDVLPLMPGEPDNTSDSHGFDFRFNHGRGRWHVEVKSTTGDEPHFDLGVTEIEAAIRLARPRRGRWRILRVRNALSDQPEFDWLPNPFQEGFKDRFRLRDGGMRVSYRRKKP